MNFFRRHQSDIIMLGTISITGLLIMLTNAALVSALFPIAVCISLWVVDVIRARIPAKALNDFITGNMLMIETLCAEIQQKYGESILSLSVSPEKDFTALSLRLTAVGNSKPLLINASLISSSDSLKFSKNVQEVTLAEIKSAILSEVNIYMAHAKEDKGD